MRRRIAIAALLMMLASAAPASAHDHRRPNAVLRYQGRALQTGASLSGCWKNEYPERGYGVGVCWTSTGGFPDPVRVGESETLSIRVTKTIRPSSVALVAWSAVDHEDRPIGPETPVSFRLVRRSRAHAWDILFSSGPPCQHRYVRLSTTWTRQDSPRSYGDVDWHFRFITDAQLNGARRTCMV